MQKDFSRRFTISTHGPARGPTSRPQQTQAARKYFNSRPREGADFHLVFHCFVFNKFQLTAPRGGRRFFSFLGSGFNPISTHGPARGPTCQSCSKRISGQFQLTAPRGGRPRLHTMSRSRRPFQLTAPRGGRQQCLPVSGYQQNISTHGPARGPTCVPCWTES